MNVSIFRRFDWLLFISVLPITAWGLLTMKTIGDAPSDYFFTRQLLWVAAGIIAFFLFSLIDWRALEANALLILAVYLLGILLLVLLFLIGPVVRGAQSWIQLPLFAFEPAEVMKLATILVLAKYFARRHVEIALSKHILISGLYVAIPTILIGLQPDVGSAIILPLIWGGMLMFSGITGKQFLWISVFILIAVLCIWMFVLAPYQQERVLSFLSPFSDPHGAGYHALQAMIATGSGGILGKGVGYGTQSRLRFLPESETDFIFAAFVEEWGFLGALLLFLIFGVLMWRLFVIAFRAESNFPKLYIIGLLILFSSHVVIHVGMNIGLLPITGIGFPFLSYGGSFFISLMAALGIAESITMKTSFLAVKKEDSSIET